MSIDIRAQPLQVELTVRVKDLRTNGQGRQAGVEIVHEEIFTIAANSSVKHSRNAICEAISTSLSDQYERVDHIAQKQKHLGRGLAHAIMNLAIPDKTSSSHTGLTIDRLSSHLAELLAWAESDLAVLAWDFLRHKNAVTETFDQTEGPDVSGKALAKLINDFGQPCVHTLIPIMQKIHRELYRDFSHGKDMMEMYKKEMVARVIGVTLLNRKYLLERHQNDMTVSIVCELAKDPRKPHAICDILLAFLMADFTVNFMDVTDLTKELLL